MHGHDVGVALNDYGLVASSNVLLGQIQAEEHLGLLVQHGLGRVHVLAQIVIVEKLAGTKADDIAGHIANRPHETTVEPIDRPHPPHLGKTRLVKLLETKAQALQVLG